MKQHSSTLALCAIGAAILAFLPVQLVAGLPLWDAKTPLWVVAMLMGGHFVGAWLVWREALQRESVSWPISFALMAGAQVPLLLILTVSSPDYSRGILLVSLAISVTFTVGTQILGVIGKRRAVVFGAFLLVTLLAAGKLTEGSSGWLLLNLAARAGKPTAGIEIVSTVLHPLKLTRYRNYFAAGVPGGGVELFGDGYLVATGEGLVWYVERGPDSELTVHQLSLRVPVNPKPYRDQAPPEAAPSWFRVVDLLVENAGEDVHLFAVHNWHNTVNSCSVLRVSVLKASRGAILAGAALPDWSTVYETEPCRVLETEGQGGRLVRLTDGSLLLSVGDHGHDGMRTKEFLSQDRAVDYGKTIRIDPSTGRGTVHTLGHRNPQGLLAARNGKIWLTEHGPRGGDELNLLVAGRNYGWPLVTHGRPYEGGPLPSGAEPGSHEGFESPAFAWLPSIGVSNLVEISGTGFTLWGGDLVIASLVGESLWRARIADEQVLYVESIPVRSRVRDLIEDHEGRLVLWTDDQTLVFLELSSDDDDAIPAALRGEILFARCQGCHPVAGDVHSLGPNLRGVLGREVAGAPGFDYSPALKRLVGPWDEEHLNRFLEDPAAFAPGNRMSGPRTPSAADRRALISYLRSLD